ncbi:hypothetical protein LEC33_28010 [Salmonella enterica]|nr:hypothetical protein [Salmonella enterica]MDJ7049751.1 hypothetical protein [Salmonella enterica]MDJ7339319.1 hypothetical protein [Salmonella enterica]
MKNSLEDLHNHLADNAVMNCWYAGSSPEYRQATLAMVQIKMAITRRRREIK